MRPVFTSWAALAPLAGAMLTVAGCGDMRAAQPAVDGGSPDLCPAYCGLALTTCQAPTRLFDSLSQCQERCAALPAGGQLGDGSGDTVACRLTYLMAEGRPDAALCSYAHPTASPACH